jgi:hypothetical protein
MPVVVGGESQGTMTMVVGGATAALDGAPASEQVTPAAVSAFDGSFGAAAPPGGTDTGAVAAPAATSEPAGPATALASPRDAGRAALASARVAGLFDIRSLYLVVAATGILALSLGQFVRLRGVPSPWTSTGG